MKLAVIPARGGSRRIPRKNIADFCGRPMLEWTVIAARESSLFDRVIVSTDDEEIARVALASGAEVPFLRDRFQDDHSPVSKVTVDLLHQLRARDSQEFDTVVQLMPNCPLRGSAHIRASYDNFRQLDLRFQLSCCRYGWLNPWWAHRQENDGGYAPLHAEALKQRSQDLPPLYCPTGAVWIARADALLEEKTFYGKGHSFFPLDWRASIDIDEFDDLEFARAVRYLQTIPTNIQPPV